MNGLQSFLTLKKIGFLLVIGTIIGSFAYFKVRSAEPSYTTVSPEVRDLVTTLEVSGYIDAYERANVHFAAGGQLAWVGAQEGETVKKWQTLASLDTRTLKKQLQQRLNLFGKAYRGHEQLRDNNHLDDAPEIDKELKRILDNNQLDLDNAVLDVEIQDLAIRLASIHSPINGVITRIDTPHAGVSVGPTDVFQVVNPDTIYFAAVVDEIDIGKIQTNQPVTVELDAYPNEPVETVIEKIDFAPSNSRSGGTGYKVHIPLPLDNEGLRYKLGMNGSASVILQEKKSILTVPVETLIYKDDRVVVEVLVDKTKTEKAVTIGMESDDYVEVIGGIEPSDQVIIPSEE